MADGPDKGKVSSFTTIRTIDATIFDDGRGNENATIVARGPGELDAPGLDKPVERTAKWYDQLTIQSMSPPDAKPGRGPLAPPATKRITLTGRPVFTDIPAQTSLASRLTTVIWLEPNPAPKDKNKTAKPADGRESAGSSFSIEQLVARRRPPGRSPPARRSPPATASTPCSRPSRLETGRPAPRVVAVACYPPPAPVAKAEDPKAKEAAPAKPAPPDSSAVANRVWAKVRLKAADPTAATAAKRPLPLPPRPADSSAAAPAPASARRSKRFDLRGNVSFHQDPEKGKEKGTDITGEAIDLLNQGENATRFTVFHHDPTPQGERPGPRRRQGTTRQGGNRRDDDQGPGDRPRPAHRPGVGRGRRLVDPARRQRPPLRQGPRLRRQGQTQAEGRRPGAGPAPRSRRRRRR